MRARVFGVGSTLVLAMFAYGATPAAACYLGDCDSLGYYETPRSYGYVAPVYSYTAPAYGYAAPTYGYAASAYGYTAPTYGYAYPRYYGARRYYAPARYYGPRRSYYYRAGVTRVGWRRW